VEKNEFKNAFYFKQINRLKNGKCKLTYPINRYTNIEIVIIISSNAISQTRYAASESAIPPQALLHVRRRQPVISKQRNE
jgi:hypothetical protein